MTPLGASPNDTAGEGEAQYLSFRLAEEEYAVTILRVQEIKGHSVITPIPNAPAHIKGVMNLRGTVVPIVGLRERFGMAQIAYDKLSVIIVVTVGARLIGVVVDAVTDVLNLKCADIQPPPEFGMGVDTSFITGMAKAMDSLVVLLDLDKTLGEASMTATANGWTTSVSERNER